VIGREATRNNPELKKSAALRKAAEVWNYESSDHIKSCDGVWIHAAGSCKGGSLCY